MRRFVRSARRRLAPRRMFSQAFYIDLFTNVTTPASGTSVAVSDLLGDWATATGRLPDGLTITSIRGWIQAHATTQPVAVASLFWGGYGFKIEDRGIMTRAGTELTATAAPFSSDRYGGGWLARKSFNFRTTAAAQTQPSGLGFQQEEPGIMWKGRRTIRLGQSLWLVRENMGLLASPAGDLTFGTQLFINGLLP